jgi:hypothetical protein
LNILKIYINESQEILSFETYIIWFFRIVNCTAKDSDFDTCLLCCSWILNNSVWPQNNNLPFHPIRVLSAMIDWNTFLGINFNTALLAAAASST